jgi:hypothetical protein
MSRASQSFVVALLLAIALVGVAFARGGAEDSAPHRIAYLYVSGQGPQAKAWYSGGPPSGVPFQDALDTFASQGFKYAAIASSGTPAEGPGSLPSTTDSRSNADYIVLLQR